MKKNKKNRFKPRLPTSAQEVLRHKGGAHGPPKGKRGYDRKKISSPSDKDGSFFKLKKSSHVNLLFMPI